MAAVFAFIIAVQDLAGVTLVQDAHDRSCDAHENHVRHNVHEHFVHFENVGALAGVESIGKNAEHAIGRKASYGSMFGSGCGREIADQGISCRPPIQP